MSSFADPTDDPWKASPLMSEPLLSNTQSLQDDPLSASFSQFKLEHNGPSSFPSNLLAEQPPKNDIPHRPSASGSIGDTTLQQSEDWQMSEDFSPLNNKNPQISVKEIPEKQGLVFKHINYLINHNVKFLGGNNETDEEKVIRRYSDFTWLKEILAQKYPFRLLPELPPKKFTVGASSKQTDSVFYQKRRRGLQRFLYQIVRHPILFKDNLVASFFTIPNDFTTWRKQAKIASTDEFTGVRINLPQRLCLNAALLLQQDNASSDSSHERFDNALGQVNRIWLENPVNYKSLDFMTNLATIQRNLMRFTETWSRLCILIERIERREALLSMDNFKFNVYLQELASQNSTFYGMDNLVSTETTTHKVLSNEHEEFGNLSLIISGLKKVGEFLTKTKEVKEEELMHLSDGTLENFKKFQDYCFALYSLVDRLVGFVSTSDRLNKMLLTKIVKAKERCESIQGKQGRGMEEVIASIESSVESLNKNLTSIILAKNAFLHEYHMWQKTKYLMSEVFRDWFAEKSKYGELYVEHVGKCFEILQDMPLK